LLRLRFWLFMKKTANQHENGYTPFYGTRYTHNGVYTEHRIFIAR